MKSIWKDVLERVVMPAYNPQEAIRITRAAIEEEIATAREALDIGTAKLQALRRRCTHPNPDPVSDMGERSMYCPDCGDDS